MCMAVPMQVIRMEGAMALCQGHDGVERIDTMLTGPLEAGQWILSFLGAAREVIDAERAAQVGDALAGLRAILDGQASGVDAAALIDIHFADLVGREPQLPAFLQAQMTLVGSHVETK